MPEYPVPASAAHSRCRFPQAADRSSRWSWDDVRPFSAAATPKAAGALACFYCLCPNRFPISDKSSGFCAAALSGYSFSHYQQNDIILCRTKIEASILNQSIPVVSPTIDHESTSLSFSEFISAAIR